MGGTGNWLPVAEGQEVFHKRVVNRIVCGCGVNAIRLAGGGSDAQGLLLLRNTGNQLPVPPVATGLFVHVEIKWKGF
ncbi:hypothetical protein [Desulfatitalea alkaliphila]|uniref:Uncharacterized protein n=1 Tax=Desulfatitalea alkaliphila TaxID=2929485 RepID=A0AA41UL59_9BACT|nr:hypothetical protein [Desulfatitalea alkaliphila]MCJ8502137.1 hypothetical protein [Desulfatitalea alkaliphila]